MPSMIEAAQIRDVAARHAYVFDSGLSSPDFFDVAKRMASEEFRLIRDRCEIKHGITEIGCFTGLNLLGLGTLGYSKLCGVEFVHKALDWLRQQAVLRSLEIDTFLMEFPRWSPPYYCDRAICFDVLEHQLNVGKFLAGVHETLLPDGLTLFLVPVGKNYYDCGHVAFFPDAECLRNVLDYYFEVEEIFELKTCKKLFASCRKRN